MGHFFYFFAKDFLRICLDFAKSGSIIITMGVLELADELKKYKLWLQPLGCNLPRWLITLFPKGVNQKSILTAAAICGSTKQDVMWGQVSFEWPKSYFANITLPTLKAAKLLKSFGDFICVSSIASILRTAIMNGLNLPRVNLGVMSQTRFASFTLAEIEAIQLKAQSILNE